MKKIITVNLQDNLLKKIEDLAPYLDKDYRSEVARDAIVWFLAEYHDLLHEIEGPDKICTFNVCSDTADLLDELTKKMAGHSRSELIRWALILYIEKIEKQKKAEEARKAAEPPQVIATEDTVQIRTADGYKSYKIIPK